MSGASLKPPLHRAFPSLLGCETYIETNVARIGFSYSDRRTGGAGFLLFCRRAVLATSNTPCVTRSPSRWLLTFAIVWRLNRRSATLSEATMATSMHQAFWFSDPVSFHDSLGGF